MPFNNKRVENLTRHVFSKVITLSLALLSKRTTTTKRNENLTQN
jgi:hypothetical protein